MKNTSAENYITILLLNRNNPAVCRKYARKGHVLFALRTGNMNLDTKNLSLETISWSFFPFQVSPVPHQQEITDSSRGRSFTVFWGRGHVAETGVWKTMESFYEREQRRTRNCVNLIYVTVGPANGTVRDMRTFFKVVVSEDIYWNEQWKDALVSL